MLSVLSVDNYKGILEMLGDSVAGDDKGRQRETTTHI
jgi:hypothetical protein